MFSLRTQAAGFVRSTASTGPRILVAAPRPRQLHISSQYSARKDDQDRESINTESNEYSKSEGDKEAADAIGDAAFSRDKTRPEQQLNTAERETKGSSVRWP